MGLLRDYTKMNTEILTIYDYWFGTIKNGTTVNDRSRLWFGGDPQTDEYIRNHFEPLLLQAESGLLDHWADSPQGCMARIILLDQFPLNMYRRSARAFEFEDLALKTCLNGLERSYTEELSYIEKTFFYLPLEHSEDSRHQAESVRLYQQLYETAAEPHKNHAKRTLNYAIKHKNIIDRFGRFPHRNSVLGRHSTQEEIDFLQDQANRFGQ